MLGDLEGGLTRREVLIVAAGGVAAAIAPLAPGEARAEGASVSGVVFEDADGSGVRGSGSPGIAGVMVSNGRDVAVTDAEGRYSLPLPDAATIFVVKPAGFMPPVDPVTELPRFYRHHQPGGAPAALDLTFDGIAPTPPLPASLDFPLRRQDEPKRFEVVLFTDPQPESEAEVDFIREDVIEALAGTTAKFGLTAGDVMFDDLSLYDRYNAIVGAIGLPWWNVGGNHDLNFEAPDRRYSRETYKRVFGPNYYAFFYAKTMFLMLDDVDYLGADKTKPHSAGKYEGRLDATQLEFVRNVLAQTPTDRLIVVVAAHPVPHLSRSRRPGAAISTNREALFALFEGRRYTVSFAGHTHTTEHHYFDAADGWTGAAAHHHHVLTARFRLVVERALRPSRRRLRRQPRRHAQRLSHPVDRRHAYKTRFVPAKEPNGRQVRISDRQPLPWRASRGQARIPPGPDHRLADRPRERSDRRRLIANVFDGGPKTKVTMRIGDRAPIEMTRRRDARSFRRRGLRAQRGDEETLGQGRDIARISGRRGCPATSRSARMRSIVEAIDRIWRDGQRPDRAGNHRLEPVAIRSDRGRLQAARRLSRASPSTRAERPPRRVSISGYDY